jgi:hypothetical protein
MIIPAPPPGCAVPWLLVSVVLLTVPPGSSQAQTAPDTTVFLQLETRWNQAHLQGDATTLDSLWAPEFVAIVPGMRPFAKTELLALVRSGRMRFHAYETSDLQVRTLNSTVVVTGRLHRERRLNTQDLTEDWLFTKTYARVSTGWVVLAFHASAVIPSP